MKSDYSDIIPYPSPTEEVKGRTTKGRGGRVVSGPRSSPFSPPLSLSFPKEPSRIGLTDQHKRPEPCTSQDWEISVKTQGETLTDWRPVYKDETDVRSQVEEKDASTGLKRSNPRENKQTNK